MVTGQSPVNLDSIISSQSSPAPNPLDSMLPPAPGPSTQVPISDEGLEDIVDYGSADSSRLDQLTDKMHLYGDAYVRYQNYSLKAPYIVVDLKSNIATADSRKNPSEDSTRQAVFADGTRTFNAHRMRFNFKTKKGIVYDVVTKETDLYVRGGATKLISDDPNHEEKEIIYNRNALITSCNHEFPHFGIRSRKQKVIPDEVVVVGPSQLEIAGIPTPLFLPFGFFPITKDQRAGVLFPRNWEFSPTWGYGFRNVGYFTPLGEHANLQATVDLYTRGTYRLNAQSQYAKRYAYNGSIAFSYARENIENLNTGLFDPRTSWGFTWTHNQDRKAHPYRRISGRATFQSNNFLQRNFNDAEQTLQNTIGSNINYSYSKPGSLVSFSAGLTHSQNTQTRQFTLNFPTFNVNVQRFYPFERKNRTGSKKWYEEINLNYTAEGSARMQTLDSLIFTPEGLESITSGIRHRSTAQMNLKVAKYFNFTPSINYTETWNFNDLDRQYDSTLIFTERELNGEIAIDTTFGSIMDDNRWGFIATRDYRASASLSTTLYGTMQFKKGKLRGLRHRVVPTLSLNYAPDYAERFATFQDTVDTQGSPSFAANGVPYNRLSQSTYSSLSRAGEQFSLGYSIANFFEGKYWSRKDSTEKKFKLLNQFNLSGNYNFAADSFQLSDLSLVANTNLFNRKVSILYSASFDFYGISEDGQVQRELLWSSDKKLFRLERAQLTVRTGATMQEIRGLFEDPNNKNTFLAMFDQWRLEHNFVVRRSLVVGTDSLSTEITANVISTRGNIQLTPNWRINIGNIGYNFVRGEVTYPDLGIVRDLHCWEMSIRTQPQRGTYQFFIRVKPGTLGFLELPWSRNRADTNTRVF